MAFQNQRKSRDTPATNKRRTRITRKHQQPTRPNKNQQDKTQQSQPFFTTHEGDEPSTDQPFCLGARPFVTVCDPEHCYFSGLGGAERVWGAGKALASYLSTWEPQGLQARMVPRKSMRHRSQVDCLGFSQSVRWI
eukprot:Skav202409  [mRNA]  locus=scaffold815:511199:512039:+ [translate_table: standard]